MRHVRRGFLICILMAVSQPAAAETLVSFSHPERFTDAGLYGGHGLEAVEPTLSQIAQYLKGLGASRWGPNQTFVVEVTNIDLAGQFEPWRSLAYNVRVMRDVYPPRMRLRFRLDDSGRTLAKGDVEIVDINYLSNPAARPVEDPLRYEKAMLGDWFRNLLFSLKTVPNGS